MYFLSAGTKGSIIGAFYGIRWRHHIVGLSYPTDSSFIQLAFQIQQRLCRKETAKKESVTFKMMKKVFERFGRHNPDLGELRFLITRPLGVFANSRTAFCKVVGYSNKRD